MEAEGVAEVLVVGRRLAVSRRDPAASDSSESPLPEHLELRFHWREGELFANVWNTAPPITR